MRLYLVQHGEAHAKEIDPERALTVQGEADIERLAGLLARTGVKVGRVLHSGKRRARQTAERLARAVAPGVEIEVSGLLNPNDDPQALDWQSDSWDRDTLIVGHLPFLAKLVSHLVVGDESTLVVGFRPGSLVRLERSDHGHWTISGMLPPELLG